MKKTLAAVAALLISVSTFGQGQVVFSTKVGADPNIRFQNGDGTGIGQSGTFTAQLVLVAANGSITALTPTTVFRSDSAAAAYYVQAPTDAINVTGTNPGDTVNLRVRAYNGATYGAAGTRFAETANISVTLGGGVSPPANLNSVQTIVVPPAVPEPSTIALGLLGVGAVLAIRRRK